MESLATPQEADLVDEQIRILMASPRYLPEREASAERPQIYHSGGEGLISSSSQGRTFSAQGNLWHGSRTLFSKISSPGRWGPQGMSATGGLVRVPNLHVCKHLALGLAHAGREGRMNVLPWYRLVGVAKTSS